MSTVEEQIAAQNKERRIELIRMVKAMQTEMLSQREALRNAYETTHRERGAEELESQFADTCQTAQNHIDALQHVIDQLK